MGDHDVERIEGDTAFCHCGWSGPQNDHETHRGLSMARAALEQGKANAG